MAADLLSRAARRLHDTAARFARDRRGNVLMILGLSIVPLTFATGMGIDYSRAEKLQTRVDAAADAAALAAVNQTMMTQTNADACTAAQNMFKAQTSTLDGLTLDMSNANQFKITLTDASGTYDCASNSSQLQNKVALRRTVTVNYHATSANAFAGILGMATLPISGTSTAFAQVSNIDFYVMMDMSQSMLLPATTTDLSKMTTATGGCAFACHQTETRPYDSNGNGLATELINNPLLTPGQQQTGRYDTRPRVDNYTLARNLGLTLRTDLLGQAVAALVQEAMNTEAVNKATYRIGLSTFDSGFNQLWPTSGNAKKVNKYWVDSNLQNVLNYVTTQGGADGKGWSNLVTEYCINNQRVCGTGDNDTDTSFTSAIDGILAKLPAQGGDGTPSNPQAMVFLITDGMDDDSSGGRTLGPLPFSLCQQLANRNITVAVLQTQYLPAAASDSWSISNVKTPYLSPTDKISPALYACAANDGTVNSWPPASGINPGVLFYQVTTDDDISAALVSLFDKAVAQARLIQ